MKKVLQKTTSLTTVKIAAMFLLLLAGVKLHAQQTPVFSAYYFNRFMVNPAFTGIDNEYRAFGFFRSQWGRMPGRPVTGGATVEGSFWKHRIGAGLLVMNDQIGIFNQTNVSLSYAQKIKFAKHHQIAIGVQGSAFINRIDFSNTHSVDYNDPSLADQKPMRAVFDLNVGISYQWKGLLIGFCVPQVIQPNAKYGNATEGQASYKYVRHYNVFAQYRISLLKNKFNITPTLFMRKGAYTGFQFDATVMLDYKNIVFAGAGYRNSFGVVTMAGVNIMDLFTVAYAYDFTTQKTLRGQVGATHEVIAGFHIAPGYKKKIQKEAEAKNKAGEMFGDLQHVNDSLAYRLKYSKQKVDSLSRVIRDMNTVEADKAEEKKRNDAEAMEQAAGDLFKSKSVTDTAGNKSTAYTLDKIYFEPYRATLLKNSREQLDSLANFMKRFPKVEILIKGYADITGKEEDNRVLSEERAQAVSVYLIEQGIANNRMAYQGFGSQFPIADNKTANGRKLNRRVEFSIVKQ